MTRPLFILLIICVFSSVAVGQPWDGNGVEGDPYLIYDACDMQAIGANSAYWDAHFRLMADIDLSGYTGTSFNMIGEGGNPFTGVFDGDNHIISNFTYSSTGTDFIGLFGAVGYWSEEIGGDIKDLVLIDPNVNAGTGHYVGSLVGWLSWGTISGCYVEGGSVSGKASGVGGLIGMIYSDVVVTRCYSMVSVNGRSSVGGLTGYNYDDGTIIDCHSVAVVSGQELVGGLVGSNYGQLYDCYSASDVSGNRGVGCLVGKSGGNWGIISNCAASGSVVGEEDFGGLVGFNTGRSLITDCYSTSAVSGVGGGGMTVGGLVGFNHGVGWGDAPRISNSYSVGGISGALDEVGGLVGCNGANGTVSNCYSSMRIEGYSGWVGGLVGVNEGTITDSYSTESISGMKYIGGLVGVNEGSISDCYSSGSVEGDEYVGGLVGYDSSSVYTSCFWDSDVNPDVNGIGNGSDPNVMGESTANMQTESTFTDAGWDFVGEVINGPNDVWTICEGEDYPRLAWEKYGGGNGTEANPYLIRTSCQMNAIGADSNDWDAHFKLMADIDLSGYTGTQFNIIGSYPGTAFTGVFDGNGHTISNFTYSSTGTNFIGLFGAVGYWGEEIGGDIKDLVLIDPNIDAGTGWSVGSLVSMVVDGTLSNCYSEGGSVSGDQYVGGLVGYSRGDIFRCYSTASVIGGSSGCGGLAGLIVKGKITSCYSSGNVSGNWRVGGLVGQNDEGAWVGGPATISDCYATGSVSGDNGGIGGLVGNNSGPVVNCYATGSVSGDDWVGGLVGRSVTYYYTKCFWDSDVNPDVNGIGDWDDPNVIGETTANMQTESTFTDAGWDFVGEVINGPNDIWDICEGTNYPRFVWQIPAADFVCPDGVNFIDYAFFAEHWLQSIYGECSGIELTGDGKVNWVDFALFAEYWKLTGCGECGGADFTGDENVNLTDLYVFATYWLGFEYAEVDLTNDGKVGLDDLREFTENWLAGM